MKKMILTALLVLGSCTSLSANYVAGYLTCDNPNEYSTIFIIKGKGSSGSDLALAAFLNSEYSSKVTKYCKSGTIYAHNGYVYSFDSKAKANKHFSELIQEYKNKSWITKMILVKKGYYEDDWK